MRITLACIVGNEESVIERFIRSFAPAVDSFFFVLAIGNQEPDLTLAIIEKVGKEIGKPCRFQAYQNTRNLPHVDDFGKARQHAWDMAQSMRPDYLLWADADDILADGAAEALRAAVEDGKHDVYLMPYHVRGDKQVVWRERMVKASIGSRWKYAVHEQLEFISDASYRMIRDAAFIHSPLDTKSGGHERNVAILKSEIADASRNFFYLAQEYFGIGNDDLFVSYANACLAIPGCGDLERYELLLNLAQTPGQDSRALAAEAFAIMPDRREALALLANYCIIDGDSKKALRLARVMMDTEWPAKTYWSQNNEWYGWKGAELYRQCLRLNGETEEADLEFDLGRDDRLPTVSIIHIPGDNLANSLAIRELWLSSAITPENVDYIFKGSQSIGFKTDSPIGSTVINIEDSSIPNAGWDKVERKEMAEA